MNTEQSSIGTFRLEPAESNALIVLLQDDASYAGLDHLVPDTLDCTCQSTLSPSSGPLPSCAFTIPLDRLSELAQSRYTPSASSQRVLTDLPTRLQRLGETCLFLKAAHLGWTEDTLAPTYNNLGSLLTDANTVIREHGVDPGVVAVGSGRAVGSVAASVVRRLSRS